MSDEKYWNYRVLRRITKEGGIEESEFFIVEVYYNKGVPYAWSDMQAPHGYDFLQLASCMGAFQAAIAKPVLEECRIDGRNTLKEVE